MTIRSDRVRALAELDALARLLDSRWRIPGTSIRLGADEWLDGAFSAGDLMMVNVLLRLKTSGLLAAYPNLVAYLARGEARPAYQRAFAAQLAVFKNATTG